MQILPIKNQKFEKPSRNPSNKTKVKILKKNFLDISQKKFGSTNAPRKCSNIKILAKIEGKEAKFFLKIYEGHLRIRFRAKKFKIISCLCTFNRWIFFIIFKVIYRTLLHLPFLRFHCIKEF
jgi:hypothetical protein